MANSYTMPEGTTEKARQVLIDVDFKESKHRVVSRCAAYDSENNMILKNTGSTVFTPEQAVLDGKITQEEVEQFDTILSKIVDISIFYKQNSASGNTAE